MDHILKDLGVSVQVCETIRLKAIQKPTFIKIINSTGGNSHQLRADLSKQTGLQLHQIIAICDRIKLELRKDQKFTLNSSAAQKSNPMINTMNSSFSVKANASGAGPQSKRISALLKQPQAKPLLSYSNPQTILQASSFNTKKAPTQAQPQIIKQIDTAPQVSIPFVQQISTKSDKPKDYNVPMISPTEVKSMVRDSTNGDSLDSAMNQPSEEGYHSIPASFIAVGPVIVPNNGQLPQQQDVEMDINIEVQKPDDIINIFEQHSSTDSEELKEDQKVIEEFVNPNQIAEAQLDIEEEEEQIIPQYQSQLNEQNEDELSLSSDSDQEMPYRQFENKAQEDCEDDYSSSSSGTLSPMPSNSETFTFQHQPSFVNEIEDQAEITNKFDTESEEGEPEVKEESQNLSNELPIENGPEPKVEQNSHHSSEGEIHGFVIQGLDCAILNEEQIVSPQPEFILEKVQIQQQDIQIYQVDEEPARQIFEVQTIQKPLMVDSCMQCDPWQPEVVQVEPEKKVMKNKKLQVSSDKIQKSLKNPLPEEIKLSSAQLLKEKALKEQQSSPESKPVVYGRTQLIPVQQFSQSSIKDSSIQTQTQNQKAYQISLSQLIEEQDITPKAMTMSYSQIQPNIKPILKRLNSEREDQDFGAFLSQPGTKRVKWDKSVEEKFAPDGESYIKRLQKERKKQIAEKSRKIRQQAAIQTSSSSSDEEPNQDSEEDLEEVKSTPIHQAKHLTRETKDYQNKEEGSSSDDERVQKKGACSKMRHNWASNIKSWLNDTIKKPN